MTQAVSAPCPNCGTQLGPALLSCPHCHRLVHGDELKRLAAEAEAAEKSGDLATASTRWHDALLLLPGNSRQATVIAGRIKGLGEKMQQGGPAAPAAERPEWTKKGGVLGVALLFLWKFKLIIVFMLTKAKLLLLGLTKMSTLLSMLLAFGVYWTAWGWKFAAGIIISTYIHEMGHVVALARYGIKATAPMFIPGFGAVVRLKQYPPTPGLDARVGLAGPLYGLAAAVAAVVIGYATHAAIWLAIGKVNAWINLFNLTPLWQLDGGRGFRAMPKKDRVISAAVIGSAWFATHESLLVLLLIAAGFRCFEHGAPEEHDRPVLLQYGFLVLSLAAISSLHVAVP